MLKKRCPDVAVDLQYPMSLLVDGPITLLETQSNEKTDSVHWSVSISWKMSQSFCLEQWLVSVFYFYVLMSSLTLTLSLFMVIGTILESICYVKITSISM